MLLLLSLIVWLGFSFYMLYRNMAVYNYRVKLLDEISEAARFDISIQRDYVWRYNAMDEVGYDQMMYRFWQPLNSFYPEGLTNMHMTKEEWEARHNG